MKLLLAIICLFLCVSFLPAQTNQNLEFGRPDVLKGLNSFSIGFVQNGDKIDSLQMADLEYFIIQKLQQEGLECVNNAQGRFDAKTRNAFININIFLHYVPIVERVYFSIHFDILRAGGLTIPFSTIGMADNVTTTEVIVYSQKSSGYSSVEKLKTYLESSLDTLCSIFLTDWRSVNKYIKTPAGVRFVPPSSTNDPYAGIAVLEK
ncbi:MAG: hypothetical protein WC469_05925 [Candidatus Omnitrophota bacterium]